MYKIDRRGGVQKLFSRTDPEIELKEIRPNFRKVFIPGVFYGFNLTLYNKAEHPFNSAYFTYTCNKILF